MAEMNPIAKPSPRILLATEDTEFDIGAEQVAIDLAALCKVPLMAVLPLVTNPEFQSIAPEREEQVEEKAAAKIDKLTQTAQARNVQLHGKVRLGEQPWHEIINEAQEQQADLIVVRRRGKRSFLANLLLGEMVHTVTGHAQCDVLIVPRAAKLWSKGIVLATDGSPNSDKAAKVAATMAICCHLPLTVISVVEVNEGDEHAAKDRVNHTLETVHATGAQASGQVISGGKPGEAILKASSELGADLVVIGRRGLNPVQRVLLGSTSEWVASHTDCPTLIVHAASAVE